MRCSGSEDIERLSYFRTQTDRGSEISVLNELHHHNLIFWLWPDTGEKQQSVSLTSDRYFNGRTSVVGTWVTQLKRPWHPDCILCGYNRNNAPSPPIVCVDEHSQRLFIEVGVCFHSGVVCFRTWRSQHGAPLHWANNRTWSGPNIQIIGDDDAQWYALCGLPILLHLLVSVGVLFDGLF